MNVVVFGAAGATGRLIVDECLGRGHKVTAFARDPKKVPQKDGVRVVTGDMMDPAAVEGALAGQDAAIHCAGTGMKSTTVRTDTAKVLVAAMQKVGVKRLVAMSGMGASESKQKMPAFVRWVIVPLMLKDLLVDQTGLEDAVRTSQLDWILVRPVGLDDKKPRRPLKISVDGSGMGMMVPRKDVAQFIAEQLTSDRYLKQAPALG
jgi:uncharacterized protein YbjT (DUF2867 family)